MSIQSSEIKDKVIKTLAEKNMCSIATAGKNNVDNAVVAYYSDGFDVYFGSFSDTLKCRNISINPNVAICIDNIQIHGKVRRIEYGSSEYMIYREKYLAKFPHYRFYFELENNELYKVTPLVIWHYDSAKGLMHRDVLIFDNDYYQEIAPYEAPKEFRKRSEGN
ncbi:MAG: pyridoxamine 5'-phosphate oxidase family protein [Clostridiaceae bacterium]|jgi:hypothetical protein|nr:pyridoxamine 5'-phosphate oxidase family protein [Clostridiaceae bacterium]